MRDRAEVHDLLHVAGAEHRKAGLTAGHHVGVVAEDVERVRSDAARGHMDDAGQQLAGDLVHIRNHQQQALRGGVRRRQSAGGKRAVHGTGSAGLRLHFDHLHRLPEYILSAVRRPLIRDLGHHRRRRDRIDAGYLRKRIGNMRCGRVAVHRYLFSCHYHDHSFLFAYAYKDKLRTREGVRAGNLFAFCRGRTAPFYSYQLIIPLFFDSVKMFRNFFSFFASLFHIPAICRRA